MRNYYYFSFCCLLHFFLTSCSESSKTANDISPVKEIKLISSLTESTMPLSALYEIESYIPLDTGEEVFIGEIGKIMVVRDTIWILDPIVEQVLGFTADGKLVTVIAQKGEGPGKYKRISDVAVSKEAIYIYDAWSGSMLKFAWNGELLGENRMNMSASHFEVLSDGGFVFYHDYTANEGKGEDEVHYNLTLTDENLQVKSQHLVNELLPAPEFLISNHKSFSKNGDELLVIESYQNLVYRIEDEGVVPYLKFNWSDHHDANRKELFKNTRSGDWSVERTMDFEHKEELGRMVELQENDKVLIGTYFKNGMVYHVFYDKEGGQVLELQKKMAADSHPVALINDLDNTLYYPLLAAQGNSFYSYTDAFQLGSGEVISERIKELLSRLSEDPNPIIVKLKIKPF